MYKRINNKVYLKDWESIWMVGVWFLLALIALFILYRFSFSAPMTDTSMVTGKKISGSVEDVKELHAVVRDLKKHNADQDVIIELLKENVVKSAQDISYIKEAIRMMNESAYVVKHDNKEAQKELLVQMGALGGRVDGVSDKLKNLFDQIIQLQQEMASYKVPEMKEQVNFLKSTLDKLLGFFPSSSHKTRDVNDQLDSNFLN